MPTYDYFCEKCKVRFEAVNRIPDRHYSACPSCGERARKEFTPNVHIDVSECAFPITHDNLDGVMRTYKSKRHYRDEIKKYNEQQSAIGRDNWRARIPALD